MVKLDRLITVLGGYGTRLVCAPTTRQTELRSVALHVPQEPTPADTEVLLAPGIKPEQTDSLVSETNAAVVVVRLAELPESAVATARRRGVAVVLVDPAVSWGQLAGVIYGLVLEGRETEAGRGPTDLFALADSIAESVGGPVTIEDHRSGVLAYSGRQETADRARSATILGRRVPEDIRTKLTEQGVFRHLASSDQPMFVDPLETGGLQGREVVAIRAGRELLGSIWVETQRPLELSQRSELLGGARAAATYLLRARASADLERQVESDLVIALVEGHEENGTALSRLGFTADIFRVVAMQPRESEDNGALALQLFERATTGFGWTRPGRSALFANTVYTILPHEDAEAANAWTVELLRTLPSTVATSVGIGGPAMNTELVESRQEADESLALHVSSGGAAAVVYDVSWHEILLRRLRRVASNGRAPARGPVSDLRRYDAHHGTHYTATLRAWLAAQGDLVATAGRLTVHPNTIRNRLRRMAEITALHFDDPRSRLAMLIALETTPDPL